MATWSSSKVKLVNNKCEPGVMLTTCTRCSEEGGRGLEKGFIKEMTLSLKRRMGVCQVNGERCCQVDGWVAARGVVSVRNMAGKGSLFRQAQMF